MSEFGRAVGGGISAFSTLSNGAGRFLNPLHLGMDVVNFNVNNIISFLQVCVFVIILGPCPLEVVCPKSQPSC